MAKIQNPATILTLVKKAKGLYQKKKPDPKSKPELRHKEIVKDLQRLRQMARRKSAGAALAKPFAARKKLLLKKLTEHRKKLNSGKEKEADLNKAQLPAYLKALLKLTRAVLRLDYAALTGEDEAGVSIDSLEEGDPAELDGLDELSAEAQQELEAEDDAALPEVRDEDEEEEADTEIPAAPPAPPSGPAAAPGEAARWEARWGKLSPILKKVLQGKPENLAQLQQTATEALKEAEAGAHGRALELLARLEPLLKEAAASLVGPQAALSPEALAAWQTARDQVVGEIRKAVTAVAATKDPYASSAIIELESIIMNLTARPQTPRAIAELERYLKTDDVITHAEEIPPWVATLRIREPLLNALQGLKS